MTDKDAEIAALKVEVARITSESKRFAEDVAVQIAELMSSCSRHRETIRVLRHRCDHIENEKITAEARVAELEAVKPLEFKTWPDDGSRSIDGHTNREAKLRALSPFGAYFITTKDNFWFVEKSFDQYGTWQGTSEASAIDYANGDHATRIRSALVSPPAPVAEAGAVVPAEEIERLKVAIEGECHGLAIDDDQAVAILGYVKMGDAYFEGAPPPPAREIGEDR